MTDEQKDGPLWQVILVVEVALLGIAAILPVTPSKTGSDTSLAEWLFPEPSYLQELLFNFVFIHLVVAVIALVGGAVWLWRRRDRVGAPRRRG